LLPDLDFKVLQQSKLEKSRLLQELESYYLFDQLSYNTVSLEKADSQASRVSLQDITLSTFCYKGLIEKHLKSQRKGLSL